MNYCGECEHLDEETFDRDKSRRCPLQQFYVFADHPACRKFSEKKRTCGECVYPYWREDGGLCREGWNEVKYPVRVKRSREACGGFKGEAR